MAKKVVLLNAKNLKKMTPAQRKRYQAHLADVRAYVRARREFQKKQKNGEVPMNMTLAEYRGANGQGKLAGQIQAENKQVVADLKNSPAEPQSGEKISVLGRLFRELAEAQDRENKLRQEISKLVG